MIVVRIITICFFSLLSTVSLAQVPTFPKCNTDVSNEPCYAEWVAENGSFFLGLIKNGLLNGKGAAVFPDGTKYVGDFRSGRRHGYGVYIMDDVPGFAGQISIGTWQNGGRVGNTLYSWPNGAYFYGFTQGGAIRSDLKISDFVEWKGAFYDLAKPQRKAIQTFLLRAKLTADRSIYNDTVDGVWGRNTFNAIATYAALMKPNQFNLRDYRSAQSVLREILTTGANHSPLGYIVGEPNVIIGASTPACPDDLSPTKYECFGSMRYEDGSVYVGNLKNGRPNGVGELERGGLIFSGSFENGELVGSGTLTENGEIVWEGDWEEFANLLEEGATNPQKPNNSPPSTGSGFLVTNDGHVISNNHVTKNCTYVTGNIGGKTYDLDVLALDVVNDLSLLYSADLQGEAVNFRSPPIRLGEEVWVAGYPFGDNLSSTLKLTKGIVSSLSGIRNDYTKFQLDAAMQPGNSGGPVLSSEGYLLGVSVSKLDEAYARESFGVTPENTNFAINNQVVRMFLAANGIAPKAGSPKTADIGRLAQKVTVFIGCNR